MNRFFLCGFLAVLVLAVSNPIWAQHSELDQIALTTTDGFFKDAVYDSSRGLVYAIGSGPASNGYLVTIDPSTGEVVGSIFAGDDSASELEISDDNSRVYITFRSSDLGGFRTFDPATQTLGPFSGSGQVLDLAINPTNPNSFTLISSPFNSSALYVDVYFDSSRRSRLNFTNFTYIDFVSTDRVLAVSPLGQGATLFDFDGTTLTRLNSQSGITGGGFPSQVGNQQAIFSSGNLIDISTLQVLGKYDTGLDTTSAAALSLEELGLTFIATPDRSDLTLSVFDSDDFTLRNSFEFEDVITNFSLSFTPKRKLFPVGENRLCVVSGSQELSFISFTTVPETEFLISPTVDARVENFVDQPSVLSEFDDSINLHYIDFANIDRRGLLEYDISALPANSVIESASIMFRGNSRTGTDTTGPNIRIYVYAGNGIAEIADANDEFPLVATSDDILQLGPIEVPLNVLPIQSALEQRTGFLGFQLRGSVDRSQFGFEASEFPFEPEPAMLSLTLSGPILGDTNIDGVVNFSDISPFITVLSTDGFLEQADCNEDGEVTFLDIAPFIAILSVN